jgi:DNA-binding NarL/FixJ family response regulator
MSDNVKKIFVVDDNEMLTFALEDHLSRKTPHEIEVYNTGEECIENLGNSPDVIILDYNLNSENPDAANGAEILAAIKKANSNTLVIMLSGSEGDSSIMETLNKGSDRFVIKSEDAFSVITDIIMGLA